MFTILHTENSIEVSFLTAVTSARGMGEIWADHFDTIFLTSPADKFLSSMVFKVHFD